MKVKSISSYGLVCPVCVLAQKGPCNTKGPIYEPILQTLSLGFNYQNFSAFTNPRVSTHWPAEEEGKSTEPKQSRYSSLPLYVRVVVYVYAYMHLSTCGFVDLIDFSLFGISDILHPD